MRWLVALAFALAPSSAMAGTAICHQMGHGTTYCTDNTPPPLTFDSTPAPTVADNIAAAQVIGSALGQLAQAPTGQGGTISQWRAADITPDTGNAFYGNCRRPGTKAAALCYGYISGYVEREQAGADSRVCFPSNGTYGQMMDVVLVFLRDHPADRSRNLSVLVYEAFLQAFPCARRESAAP